MQLMRHDKHGLMNVYSPLEVEEAKKHGWYVIDRHPGLDKAQGVPADEAPEPAAARRGRTPKVIQP
jgi:hypothetical protein